MVTHPATASAVFRFGDDFELDIPAYELRSGGIPLKLKPIPLELLMFLVERQGEMVTREQIVERVWGKGVFLDTDNSINGAISKIRQVLRDDATQPRFVQTVTGRGYRFIAAVTEPLAEPPSASKAAASVDGLIGKKVSHYRILALLGGGGMGVVYKAEDLKLGRRVAIKFLPSELAREPKALARLESEARAASALDHRNICSIYELDEHDGQPFIVMQLLEGQTLQEQIDAAAEEGAPMPLARVLTTACQVAEGLQAAHEKGFIHRDIKPANIFITRSHEAKILDFGLAKNLEEDTESYDDSIRHQTSATVPPSSPAHRLRLTTMTGKHLGTAFYMSPEQIRGEKLDARTDIFSFGLVLYQMLSGQRAFPGNTTHVVHDGILNNNPVPLREIAPKLPTRVAAIVDRCLEKERDRRYQSATEMRVALDQPLRQGEPGITKTSLSGRWRWFAIAALIVLTVGGGLYWQIRHTVRATADDTIVLGDFTNETSDPVLGDALNVALDTEFSQTSSLTLLSMPKRREALKLMGLDPSSRLTAEVAQEVCRRTNSKIVVEPSVSDDGDRYQIVLRALKCQTARVLTTVMVEAERRSDLVKMTGVAGYQVRQKLGEPAGSLHAFNEPLDLIQSASPEAIQAVSQARATAQIKGDREALPYAKRAADLDPLYVSAYIMMSTLYLNLGEDTLSRQAATKAYDMRDRLGVNNRYRKFLESYYYGTVLGDVEMAMQFNQQLVQQYPNSARDHANVGAGDLMLGRFEQSIPQSEEANRLYPESVFPYWNLLYAYLAANQLDDARSVFERAMARKLDADELHDARYRLAFVEGDEAGMQEQVAWATGKPIAKSMLLREDAQAQAYHGRIARARILTQKLTSEAERSIGPDAVAQAELLQAWAEAEVGKPDKVRKSVEEALKLKLPQSARALAAVVFVRVGDTEQAAKLANKLNQEFPRDTFMQHYWLPSIAAAIALHANHPQDAIRALAPAATYESGLYPAPTMLPVYLRGLAYLKAGQAQQASVEFKKMLDHPGVIVNYVTGALAQLQLARAQAMMGNTEAARKSYQDFLVIWKSADADLPSYRAAKAEYARL